MAGYDYYAGKSNAAVEAEDRGLLTASALAKEFGLRKAATVEEFLNCVEWHHSSKYFNQVGYYAPADVTPELLVSMTAAEKAARIVVPEVIEDCRVEWSEWEGSRKRPVRIQRSADHVKVSVKGDWASFEVRGIRYRKKLSGRYFVIHYPSEVVE